MAKHTFVTASHTTWDETKTVEILSRTDIKKLVSVAVEDALAKVAKKEEAQLRQNEKFAKQNEASKEDATEARKVVSHFIETARETFRDVIAELLAPHYRYLEEHLGIKPLVIENESEKTASKPKRRSSSKKTVATQKEIVSRTKKNKTTTRRQAKTKGDKPCRKK